MKLIQMLMVIFLVGCHQQNKLPMMNETEQIQTAVTKVFVHSDNRNWKGVEAQFAPKVNLDYSSMSGSPAAEVTPQEITAAWKTVLPGFKYTHHQIGNFLTSINGDKAHSFCYGTATHYLDNLNGNVWTVVGSYDFDLEKINNEWKVSSMVFNFKYQDGNTNLVEAAIENAR